MEVIRAAKLFFDNLAGELALFLWQVVLDLAPEENADDKG